MSETLDKLIDQLNYIVDKDLGIKKSASRKRAQENVLKGDRTDLQGEGDPASLPANDEMEDSMLPDTPQEELYDPTKDKDKNLEEERQKEVLETGESTEDESLSSAEKTAALANKILKYYQKKAEEKIEEEEKEEEEEEIEEEETEEDEAEKKAGYKAFFTLLKKQGAPFLRKCASIYDRNYKTAVNFFGGKHLADYYLQKEGQAIADSVIRKQGSISKEAQICKNAYNLGAMLAEKTIMKLAADLIAVQPVLQDLFSKGILTEEEKNSLVSALASAEVLTPDVVNNAVQGLSNKDEIAAALIKSLEGVVAPNVVPQPSTNVIPTPEALPGGTPTIDSAIPIATTLDVTPEKMIEQKAQELIDAVSKAENKKDEDMIIQAAQRILKKRGRK